MPGDDLGMEKAAQLSWKSTLRQRSTGRDFPGDNVDQHLQESETLNSHVVITRGSADTRNPGLGWAGLSELFPNLMSHWP